MRTCHTNPPRRPHCRTRKHQTRAPRSPVIELGAVEFVELGVAVAELGVMLAVASKAAVNLRQTMSHTSLSPSTYKEEAD